MIILSSTDTLTVTLGGAIGSSQHQCVASYREITSTAFTPQRSAVLTTGVTPVTLVSAPALTDTRVVDFLSVYNADLISNQVTVAISVLGTPYTLFSAALAPGEKVEYQEGAGFRVIATSGAVKTSLNQGNSPVSSATNLVVLGSDVINSNGSANTLEDVTGLSFPVTSGTLYFFTAQIQYYAAATTTGSRWTINGPAFTQLTYVSRYTLTMTTQTTNMALNAYQLPAAANASSGATNGNIATLDGFILPSVNGTVQFQFASEVASSAITAKAGSFVEYTAIM